jgi:hypothetical protein
MSSHAGPFLEPGDREPYRERADNKQLIEIESVDDGSDKVHLDEW